MRNKFILILLLSLAGYSQSFVGIAGGFDIRNAMLGSKATNSEPALNYFTQIRMVGKRVEVNLTFEEFPRLDFKKYSFGVGINFPLYAYPLSYEIKTIFTPTIEPTLIDRHGDWGGGLSYNGTSSHFSLALTFAFDWKLTDKIMVGYVFSALPRTDLSSKYPKESWSSKVKILDIPVVGSNYFRLTYTFDIE